MLTYHKRKIVDSETTIQTWLVRLLSEEYQAWYQYTIVAPFLHGEERPHIQETFITQGKDELDDHAAQLLQRLHDLGSDASAIQTPTAWSSYAGSSFVYPTVDVPTALKVMLESEQAAINSYTEAYEFALTIQDYVSADIFKKILADEQEHFAELQHFITDSNK